MNNLEFIITDGIYSIQFIAINTQFSSDGY